MPLLLVSGTAAAQESDSSPGEGEAAAPRTESGECFTASAVVDMTVFNDRSVYVRTRSRHFLLTTRQQCINLQRAYNRNAVGFVPFGRRICPSDGSHFRYETGGRERICPIGLIAEVDDRAQGRELAEQRERSFDDDLLITRDLDLPDQEE
jgi:hypothetical protein